MPRPSSLGLVLGSVLVASVASAETPAPRYAQIPLGTPTALPAKAQPGFVPRGASVPGMFVSKSAAGNPDGVDVTGVASRDSSGPPSADETRTCFADMSPDALANVRGNPTFASMDWAEQGLNAEVQLYRRSRDFPQGGVTAVHSERFEEKNGAPVLEIVDAWVDPATHGARVFDKKTLPLALVGTSAVGVRVFAMRDERAKDKLVQFVLVPDAKQRADGTASMIGVPADGHTMVRSQCGHLRLGVPVTEEGSSAQLFTAIVVSETKPEPKAEPVPAPERRSKKRRRIVDADGGEKKFRALSAQVSVSKTARDPEPVVSVSFGWAARESSQRFF